LRSQRLVNKLYLYYINDNKEFIEDIIEEKRPQSGKKTLTKSAYSSTGFSKRHESLEPKTLVYSPTKTTSPVNKFKTGGKVTSTKTANNLKDKTNR